MGTPIFRLPMVSVTTIAASLCIGFGDAQTLGQYGVVALVLVATGVLLTWIASKPERAAVVLSERATRVVVVLSFAACFVAAVSYRGGLYGTGRAEIASVVLVIIGASAALVFAASRRPGLALAWAVALIGAACVAMVIASPAPRIDVWDMYQAVARGLLHGHNVYTQHWSPELPNQAKIYAYFPGAAVILTPFYALFGDVRFGVILALLLSAVLIGRLAKNPQAGMFGALLLLYPYLTFSVEQSWSEPLTLLVLLSMVWAVKNRKYGWATVALAVMLTFQQYDLVLVPLAAAWTDFGLKRTIVSVTLAAAFIAPWALAARHAFVEGAIVYNLHYLFSYLSLSVFHRLSDVSGVLAFGVLVVGVGVALLVGMKRVHNGQSFLMACGVVVVTLDLLDKVSRFNEWNWRRD